MPATWWWPPCCLATATSRDASRPTCGPTTWRPRRWWSPTPWRAPSTSTSPPSRWATTRRATRCTCADIWPTQTEVDQLVAASVTSGQFHHEYASVFEGSEEWKAIPTEGEALFAWDPDSTYVQEPPFFTDLAPQPRPLQPITAARVLLKLGDSVTTDHISPAGSIGPETPAGRFLLESGVTAGDVQQLRVTPGQRPGDDPGHVRQHPHPQRARPRHRGRAHHRLHRRHGQDRLRGEPRLPGGGRPAGGARRPRLRDGLVPGLGGQGHVPARGQGGDHRLASSGSTGRTW